jgi:hypothetical protein
MTLIYIHGIGIPLIMVSRTTIRHLHTTNKYHGRLFSVAYFDAVGTSGLSFALVGIINAYISVKVVFLFIGIGASLFTGLRLSVKQKIDIQ